MTRGLPPIFSRAQKANWLPSWHDEANFVKDAHPTSPLPSPTRSANWDIPGSLCHHIVSHSVSTTYICNIPAHQGGCTRTSLLSSQVAQPDFRHELPRPRLRQALSGWVFEQHECVAHDPMGAHVATCGVSPDRVEIGTSPLRGCPCAGVAQRLRAPVHDRWINGA